MIPYGRHEITEADIDGVIKVLKSDFLTQGPIVPQFEKQVATMVQVKHAVAVNSATSALHIACLALGLGKGDILWTTPITFVASANCARYCGADVDFVDIDARTFNMSPDALEEKLVAAERDGRLPKVIVPVHLTGQPCEMARIKALADKFNVKIIEDASHAIGGSYKEEPVGNCRYCDIAVFSFHPVKIITTAEGGMALTNDADLARRMEQLRSHGINRDMATMDSAPDGEWYYEQQSLGFNYRMTDLHAALGQTQLKRIDSYVSTRHDLAAVYDEKLASLPIKLPWQHPDGYSAFHLYVIRVDGTKTSSDHAEVFAALRSNGVGVSLHYIPVYRHPYYRRMNFSFGNFPHAESYYAEAISIPLYPTMTDANQQEVVRILGKVLRK